MNTSRLEKEANIRKKLEEALKDAQRAIADKEALLQDANLPERFNQTTAQ